MWILLLLLFIFVIWPLIRVAIAVNRVKKNARQAYEAMYGQQAERPRQRKAGWSTPETAKKKKIDRNVGDYVAYEELPAEPATGNGTRQTPRQGSTEQQIVDADWEEIV